MTSIPFSRYIFPFFFLILLQQDIVAQITLPQVLGNNMVVQREKPVAVWGHAPAQDLVTVTFKGQVKQATADTSGKWMIWLDPLPASDQPADMLIQGSGNTISLHNILVGDVWYCSGQSNMEYSMRKNSKVKPVPVNGGHSPVDELHYAENPDIRIFLALRKPLQVAHPAHEGWSIARDSALRSFSAAGYFFAKKLYSSLHVPIGVISNAIPGSAIEPWLAGTIMATDDSSHRLTFDYQKPGKFYPTLVATLAPFTIKGMLWYQGETNCFMNQSLEYAFRMKALIHQWRSLWKDSTLGFYYVQIAPFYYSKNKSTYHLTDSTLPRFWEAQSLALQIPHTGMTVSTDLPDDLNGIHPPGKWVVGERLALIALAKTYAKPVEYSGPVYTGKRQRGHHLILSFDHVGKGLVSKDGKSLDYFEIAAEGSGFVPAHAVIRGSKVILSSPEVARPAEARFGWNEGAQPNFFNKSGLPAAPFRTNNPYRRVILKNNN